jgi:hypothetical protein
VRELERGLGSPPPRPSRSSWPRSRTRPATSRPRSCARSTRRPRPRPSDGLATSSRCAWVDWPAPMSPRRRSPSSSSRAMT